MSTVWDTSAMKSLVIEGQSIDKLRFMPLQRELPIIASDRKVVQGTTDLVMMAVLSSNNLGGERYADKINELQKQFNGKISWNTKRKQDGITVSGPKISVAAILIELNLWVAAITASIRIETWFLRSKGTGVFLFKTVAGRNLAQKNLKMHGVQMVKGSGDASGRNVICEATTPKGQCIQVCRGQLEVILILIYVHDMSRT
jgi:hypothetical protein